MATVAAAPAPPSPSADPHGASYAASVARRLSKNRTALFGIYAVVGLVAVATLAPLLALNQPFFWNAGAGIEFPWFSALFNRLLFENSVDIFFNLLLVTAPLVWLAARWLERRNPGLGRARAYARCFGAVGVLFVAVSIESIGPLENPLHFTEKVVNYRVERDRLAELGQAPQALFPVVPYSHRETDPARSLESPNGKHWIGTDVEGRDVFCRMLYGTRISLTIGVVAVIIYVSIGTVLGALAGYFGGWVDNVISRLVEVMITFPSFFLILTLAALIQERSIFHVMLIIGLTSWTGVARLVRAEFLRQKSLDYVQAALAMGLSRRRVIFRHILPNAVAPALVSATFGIASAILIESTLSFLGVGDVSVASWGETLNAGRVQQKLWLVLAPGAAIFFVVTMFNLVGEGIRDALDPKLRI
ncbi:MAG TPA: ABC transporter permease [Polyangiaceae bacterium]|nr:ABC transporter permease [Polyangiaceae bacterium]